MAPVPEVLPPFREVNHWITFINPNKRYLEQRATCTQALKGQLQEKAKQYKHAKWWVRKPTTMACPLLCLAKKDSSLQTVIDARNRNANLVLDITPMLDMHFIIDSLTRNTYRSKINMTDAYEQIHVEMDCVLQMAFATPWGTYVSNVLQQV